MRFRMPFTALFAASLLLPLAAMAAQTFDYQESTLDNGLKVITLEDFSCPIVAVQVWYHVGSKNERADRQGFAHMFEHMMFRGTDKLGPEAHFAWIRGSGGDANGFTSFDMTAYVNTLPANQLDLALWLEAERMMFLKIDQEGFDTERQVVSEERRQRLNEPYGTIFERAMPLVFQKHPYRWLPIGKIHDLNQSTVEELKAFWDTYYVPDNATLVIVGAVHHKDALKAAQRFFGWMPRLPEPPKQPELEPAQTAPREATLTEGIGPAPLLRCLYRAVPENNPDYVPIEVLSHILGGGESSRLYRDLVKDKRICQDASAELWGLEQDGLLMLGIELLPNGNVEGARRAMYAQIEGIRKNLVSPEELDKAKNQLRRSVVTDTLTVESKAQAIGDAVILHGSPECLNQQLDDINRVTAQDVQRVAQTYLAATRLTEIKVEPTPGYTYEPEPEKLDEPPAPHTPGKAAASRPAGYPETPPAQPLIEKLPRTRVKQYVLANGLKVVVLPNDEVPFVTAMLALREGPWTETAETPGAASMALSMLTKGTERFTAAQLAELIERNALTLGGGAGSAGGDEMDTGSITATALTDKLPLALELMADVARHPTFPQDELAILKEQRQLSLSVQEKDPSYLAERELRRVLFGGHPYARSAVGELADVARLEPAMLKAWWSAHVRPEAAVLYIAGDVKPRDAKWLAEQYFGDWTASGAAQPAAMPALPAAQPMHIYIVDRPGAVQSQIRVGQLSGLTRQNPEFQAARVLAQVLGSGFNSRLNKELRIKRGLTYGVWGYFDSQQGAGEFMCGTFTKTETTAETVQALLDVIKDMQANPPTEEELNAAKSYLVGSFAGRLETPQDAMSYQWIIEHQGLGKNYLNQALKGYRETTKDSAMHIAKDVIRPSELAIVVAGDAAQIKDSLAAIAPVSVVQEAAGK